MVDITINNAMACDTNGLNHINQQRTASQGVLAVSTIERKICRFHESALAVVASSPQPYRSWRLARRATAAFTRNGGVQSDIGWAWCDHDAVGPVV